MSLGDVAALIITMTSHEKNVVYVCVCLCIYVFVQIHRIIKQKQHSKEFRMLATKIHTESQNPSQLRCEHSARESLSHPHTHTVWAHTLAGSCCQGQKLNAGLRLILLPLRAVVAMYVKNDII